MDGVLAAERLGVNEHFQVLTGVQMRERISSPVFRAAPCTGRWAQLRIPRACARDAARAAGARGPIYEQTPVTRFGAGEPAIAETFGGASRPAPPCSPWNAWAHHWKRFRRTVVIRGSYIVLTAPAFEQLKEIG